MVDLSQKISKSSPQSCHEKPCPEQGRRGSEESVPPPRLAPNPEQLRGLLTSPEGQALIRLLRADGGAGLRQAAAALRSGDEAGVREALTPLLAGTEAEALTRSLEGKL